MMPLAADAAVFFFFAAVELLPMPLAMLRHAACCHAVRCHAAALRAQ